MKSKIGISTWCLQQLTHEKGATLFDMMDMAAAMGADGIDICEEYLPCHPTVDLHRTREIKKRIKELKLSVGAVWFCADVLSAIHADSVERAVSVFRRNIALTAEMEAKHICIPFLLNIPGQSHEEAVKRLVDFFERVLPCAEEYGIPIAHEAPRQYTPELALRIRRTLASDYYTICPDLEAWRVDTPDIFLGAHAESLSREKPAPASIETFRECLPYSPYIHFKLLSFDEQGEEPHFPIPKLMREICESGREHYLCIEYEGWLPDFHPGRDAAAETKKGIDLIRRYEEKYL